MFNFNKFAVVFYHGVYICVTLITIIPFPRTDIQFYWSVKTIINTKQKKKPTNSNQIKKGTEKRQIKKIQIISINPNPDFGQFSMPLNNCFFRIFEFD